ncbi:MAG: ARMT1-like domain-containing protein, partial [Methanobacteriota archaeon]
MHHDDRCFDCLLSRVRLEADLAGTHPGDYGRIYGHAAKLLSFLHNTPYTHPVVASLLHRSVYNQIGTLDPFLELKEKSNHDAKIVLDIIKSELKDFTDIVTAAVIGNIFDYGVKGHTIEDDFLSFFKKEFSRGLYIDDTPRILPLCKRVVYLTDNCGEIIFDRYLLTYLK